MSILVKGTDFGPTEQVTSTKLDNLVDAASFTNTSEVAVSYSGSTGTCLQGGGLEVTSAGQLQVKDGEITTVKLNDNAVTTAKITDLNVTTAKIAADAITTAKIADDVELGGNPTTTTQAAGNNSTRIATTAFVNSEVPNLYTMSDVNGDVETSMASDTESVTFPNGLIMKWGIKNATGDSNTDVTFATAFPTGLLNVQCTHNQSFNVNQDGALGAISASTTGFTIRNGMGTSGNVYWQAVGF